MEELDRPSGDASGLEELVLFVENHPDNHEQRWKLAKKLYMAWEYKRAMDHLLVLKRDWTRKVNVLRYLAASYYRLGRYEDAIAELRAALELWPEDVGVREQLARVCEVAGRIESAIDEWEMVQNINPNSTGAGRALARLRAREEEAGSGVGESEFVSSSGEEGIDLSPKRACPHCGSQNNAEFERCWQCHAPLTNSGEPTPMPIMGADSEDEALPWLWTLVTGLFTVAFVSAGMYLALRGAGTGAAESGSAPSLETLFGPSLLLPRSALGGTLALAWPLALWLSFFVLRGPAISMAKIVTTGLLLASLAFLFAWVLPLDNLNVFPIALLALSFALIVGGFGVKSFRALGAWCIQAILIGATCACVLWGTLGPEPLRQYRQIVAHVAWLKEAKMGTISLPSAEIPYIFIVTWKSSGSSWLDARASMATFELNAVASNGGAVQARLLQGDKPVVNKILESAPYFFSAPITPGESYTLSVRGPEGTPVYGTLRSYLKAELRTFGVDPRDPVQIPADGAAQ